MKALAFTLAVVVAGLAGCSGGTRSPLYNEREAALPPGEGMLGDALTFDSSKRTATPAPSGCAGKRCRARGVQEVARIGRPIGAPGVRRMARLAGVEAQEPEITLREIVTGVRVNCSDPFFFPVAFRSLEALPARGSAPATRPATLFRSIVSRPRAQLAALRSLHLSPLFYLKTALTPTSRRLLSACGLRGMSHPLSRNPSDLDVPPRQWLRNRRACT